MLRVPADEAQSSLFRQIDERMESRLRRIDLTGTPTVSGDDDPSSSDEAEEEVEAEEVGDEGSQHSNGSFDPSEYHNRLMQRYRQAIEDGDQQLANDVEREIFERWINLQ